MPPPEADASPSPGTASRAQQSYDDFFGLAYADGALDRKTKILVALGASLGAGCAPWTAYCLSVGRELGVSEAEIDEAVHLAMTVGASKTLMLAKAERRTLGAEPQEAVGDEADVAAFKPAEVVASAEGGWDWTGEDAGSASPDETPAVSESKSGSGWT